MAIFEGNQEDFQKFINGYTRNLVQTITRKHKKNRSCSVKGCRVYTKLQAAHLSGHERPKIVSKIITKINTSTDLNYFRIDLNEFETEFLNAHTPIDKSLIILCHAHHVEYDKGNNTIDFTDIIPIESENDLKEYKVLLNEEILSSANKIKIGKLVQKSFIDNFQKLSKKQIDELCSEQYCKNIFNISFPVLKEFKNSGSFYDSKKNQRYYKDESVIFSFGKRKYLLTKEWKSKHEKAFLTYIKSI